MTTNPALRALTELVHHVRTVNVPAQPWDRPGILAALDAALRRSGIGLADLAAAAIRAAQSDRCQTPAVIPLDGEHWRGDSAPAPRVPAIPRWDHQAHAHAVANRATDQAAHAAAARAALRTRTEETA